MKKIITINSILGGHQKFYHQPGADQFLTSIGIDPDDAVDYTNNANSDSVLAGGAISPTAYANIAGTGPNGGLIAGLMVPAESRTSMYAVTATRRLLEYDLVNSDTETFLSTIGGVGDIYSGIYYSNFLYFFTNTNVARFGPLSSAGPVVTSDVWTGATLGSQTALNTPTTATVRFALDYPAHPPFLHPADGRLYFGDVNSTQNGVIHFIQTTYTGTNNGSTYEALDLPAPFIPKCITNLGTNLVIGANNSDAANTSVTGMLGTTAALFIWDTLSPSYSRIVFLPDPWVSALYNHNGVVYGWSGWPVSSTRQGGFQRFWKYDGGYTVQTIFTAPSSPPRQPAVAAYGDRIVWATYGRSPVDHASILAYNSMIGPFGGIQNIAQTNPPATVGGTEDVISAIIPLRYAGDGSNYGNPTVNLCFGSTSGGDIRINKRNSTTTNHITSYWRSRVFNVGKTFTIKSVRMGLGNYVSADAANQSFVLTAFFDNEATSQVATTFNSTNFPIETGGGPYFVVFKTADFSGTANGRQNFFLEIKLTGTKKLVITLPITIELEVSDNEML